MLVFNGILQGVGNGLLAYNLPESCRSVFTG
jgi:hypothetical protein